jgi:TonB-dependent SusC/RagA subfamily outer membrane receptor
MYPRRRIHVYAFFDTIMNNHDLFLTTLTTRTKKLANTHEHEHQILRRSLSILSLLLACIIAIIDVAAPHSLQAQSATSNSVGNSVSAVVKNEKTQELLPGVLITLKSIDAKGADGRSSDVRRGAVSGKDGRFRMENLPLGTYSVQAVYLGFKPFKSTIAVQAAQPLELTITLQDDPIRSEEVIVSGQGVGVERRRVSTNTSVVSSEQLERVPVPRLEQVLQAQIPNAQFSARSGLPGGTSTIRSRGIGSVSSGSTPIIYVDGVRLDNLNTTAALTTNVSSFTTYTTAQSTQTSALADIPMDNIERVEFLNGGAATTLYGSDAANGVIHIFTKNGLGRPTSITAEARLGVDAPTTQFLRFKRTPELLYRAGFTQQYLVSASGGGADWGFSVAGNAQRGDGFRINNSQYENYSLRVGLNANLASTLRYISSFGFSSNSYRRAKDGNAGNYTPLWIVEDGLGIQYGFPSDIDAMPDTNFAKMKEFVRRAEDLINNRVNTLRFQTSQALEFEPLAQLRIKALAGVDFRRSNERVVITNEYLVHTQVVPAGTTNRGSLDDVTRDYLGLTFEATAQHRTEIQTGIGELSLVSNVGGQLFRTSDEQYRLFGDNVRDGATTITGAGVQTGDQFRSQVVNYGVYALENIGLQNKYFLELGLRADGNTAFGRDVGLQVFPKVGVSYVLSDEAFFEPLRGAIPNLRLRANYGVAGNFPPPFRRDRTIAFNSYNGQPAASFGQPENPTLRPERTATTEFGLDASVFDNVLTLGATWYNALTSDALFSVPLAPSQPETVKLSNVGQILNRGLELRAAATLVNTTDVRLQLTASLNTTYNEVLNAGGTQPFAIGGYSARTVQNIVAQGAPVGFLRGYKAEVTSDTSYVVRDPLANLGSTIPTSFGSVSLSATLWNALNVFISSDYQFGAWAHSFDQQFRFLTGIGDNRIPASLVQAYARRGIQSNQIWTDFTNFFVERTDFWRVRLISVSYDLPTSWFDGSSAFKHITVGVSVTNPFGWTAATFDPEAANAGTTTQNGPTITGASYGIDSAPRTVLGTVKIRF